MLQSNSNQQPTIDNRQNQLNQQNKNRRESNQTLGQSNNRRSNDRSLNHLLGFTLAPRPQQIHSNFTHGTRRPTRKNQSNHNRFDQEIFVHAKYRFILKPTGDYTAHFADPDIRFNWPGFSRHNLGSNKGPAILAQEDPQISQLACPICLSPPTAPRMTRCGHIFCYPCLLHYIELSDEGKGQGPARHSEPTSSLMCFRLVERPNFTTLALPRSPTCLQTPWHFTPDALALLTYKGIWKNLKKNLPPYQMHHVCSNCRGKASLLKTNFVMTSRKQALKQIADAFQPEKNPHSSSTLISSNLGTMMSTDEDRGNDQGVNSSESKNLCTTDKLQESTKSEIIDHCFKYKHYRLTTIFPLACIGSYSKVRRNVNPSEPISSAYRFYQAASGEIYLSSLDFESYDKFPDFIALEVEAYVEGRYLSHLSVGSELQSTLCCSKGERPKRGLLPIILQLCGELGRGISSATRGKRNWKSNKVTINISGGYGGRAT
ncbi:hypothetical protein BY996DRAFT_8127236 [Phakopsora pachyrhizi]|nr:hypothetical protein BY996DRAFT_8127236 [Phakopsora pachyrhizi]